MYFGAVVTKKATCKYIGEIYHGKSKIQTRAEVAILV